MELTLRLLTLALFVTRSAYWIITERQANVAKPKLTFATSINYRGRLPSLIVVLIIAAQLLGLPLLQFPNHPAIELLGFALVAIGFGISMSARHTLGTNWAHAAEYQIKSGHELVTTGIYRYLRHPIYSGLALSAIGAELVAGSWLAIALLLLGPIPALSQAKKEETILIKQFGQSYRTYMRRTKMFLPFIW